MEADALYRTQFEICRATMHEQLKYMGTSTVVRDIDYITTQLEGPEALMLVFQHCELASTIDSFIVVTSTGFLTERSSGSIWSTCKYFKHHFLNRADVYPGFRTGLGKLPSMASRMR